MAKCFTPQKRHIGIALSISTVPHLLFPPPGKHCHTAQCPPPQDPASLTHLFTKLQSQQSQLHVIPAPYRPLSKQQCTKVYIFSTAGLMKRQNTFSNTRTLCKTPFLLPSNLQARLLSKLPPPPLCLACYHHTVTPSTKPLDLTPPPAADCVNGGLLVCA